jgi:hypothetical protein
MNKKYMALALVCGLTTISLGAKNLPQCGSPEHFAQVPSLVDKNGDLTAEGAKSLSVKWLKLITTYHTAMAAHFASLANLADHKSEARLKKMNNSLKATLVAAVEKEFGCTNPQLVKSIGTQLASFDLVNYYKVNKGSSAEKFFSKFFEHILAVKKHGGKSSMKKEHKAKSSSERQSAADNPSKDRKVKRSSLKEDKPEESLDDDEVIADNLSKDPKVISPNFRERLIEILNEDDETETGSTFLKEKALYREKEKKEKEEKLSKKEADPKAAKIKKDQNLKTTPKDTNKKAKIYHLLP